MRVSGAPAAIPEHVHASWCLLAVERGERIVLSGGWAFTIAPGRAALLPPGVAHSCPAGAGECSYLAACFSQADEDDNGARPRGVAVFEALGLAAGFGEALRTRDEALLERLCDKAMERAQAAGWTQTAPHRRAFPEIPAVAKARGILDDPNTSNLPLEGVARMAGASLYHLSRRFKLETGLTPHEYRTLARLRQARALLASGASPAEAAAQCGFCDQSHLNLRFGKYMGMTPGRYRRACS